MEEDSGGGGGGDDIEKLLLAKKRYQEAKEQMQKHLVEERQAAGRAEAAAIQLTQTMTQVRSVLEQERVAIGNLATRRDELERELRQQRSNLTEQTLAYGQRRSAVERSLFGLQDRLKAENVLRMELASALERIQQDLVDVDTFCAELHQQREHAVAKMEASAASLLATLPSEST